MVKNRFNILSLLFLLVLALYSEVGDARLRCIESEKQALLKFKKGLEDDYDLLSSWGSEEECCEWWGVECSNRTSHVVVLDLHLKADDYRYLRGEVSHSLSDLQHLRHLDLSYNHFNGSQMGEVIGSLHRLKYLNLSRNDFGGEVSHQLGNLTSLESLDLGLNSYLTTTNLEWLSRLRLLRQLDLTGVSIESVNNWMQVIFNLPLVEELRLRSCELGSAVPSSSLILPNSSSSESLSILDLSDNGLTTSSIYHWLFNVSKNVVSIDLTDNNLQGVIPDAFGEMTSLEDISLGGNHLQGGIPESFSNLSHLRSLDLSFNGNLSEHFPRFLQKLSTGAEKSLESLNLWMNQFDGPLTGLTRFSSLRKIYLGHNRLTELPSDVEVLSSLRELSVNNNILRGRIPESIGKLSMLEFLDLSSNFLSGSVTEIHLSRLSNLRKLYLSYNSLTLNLSSRWVPPFQLEVIGLANCSMGSHFPKWLRSQNNFSTLDLSLAGISDTLPDWFWDLSPRLEFLNLSHNEISSAKLPSLSQKFHGYPRIDLSSNNFSGPMLSIPSNLTSLYLYKNRFEGSVSFLCAIANDFSYSFDISNNLFSGDLPGCWMNTRNLAILNLGNNNLSGEIPTSLSVLINLESLHLRNNSFVGEIPSSLQDCTQLKVVDIGGNKLTGNIPTWIGLHLSELVILSVRSNKFSGNIPQTICYLSRIQILDLSRNDITGEIPHCLFNFTALVHKNSSSRSVTIAFPRYTIDTHFGMGNYMDNVMVQWKSQDSEFREILGYQKTVDFSSNKLVGQIPEEIANLTGLISLNLSANLLTGNIIERIDQMEMLESLDLSRNKLSGEIPTGLARLNYLSVLDLSNNNLSGRIPSSTQLQSFDASTYIGNNGLCDLPLEKCTDPQPSDHENNDQDEDEIVTKEFYISIGIGFFVGLWGIYVMLFKDSWRYVYFGYVENTSDWIYATSRGYVARFTRRLRG